MLWAGLLGLLFTATGPSQDLELEAVLRRMNVALELPEGARTVPIAEQAQGSALEDYVPMFTVLVLMCIAQEDICFGRMVELPEESVSREFGADHGLSALLKGGSSEFRRGYRYVVVNSFYKQDRGVVNVYFLYDEPEDLDMDSFEYASAYYCFSFTE